MRGVLGGRGLLRGGVLLVVPLVLAATALLAPAPVGATPAPVRIALLGDSITQGSAGDFTWRYFLWKHLVADDVDADLVGPESDLYDRSTAYADQDFDRDHAARWGDAYSWIAHPVPQLVAGSHPDVLVVLLGLNDLTFAQLTPQQVLDQTHQAVQEAQSADPDVKVVLCRLPTTWIAGVDAFNALLSADAPGWSTSSSAVVVAASDAGYEESSASTVRDTWDEVHPDAAGEQKIAAAVSDALAGLGIGSAYPRPLADVPLGPRTRPVLSVVAADRAVDLTWTTPPGATAERIWLRDVTAGSPEVLLRTASGTSTRVTGLVDGHDYDLSLQAVKGLVPAEPDVRSTVVRVRPGTAVPARVAGLRVRAGGHAWSASWSATGAATSYRVWWRDLSAATGWSSRATTARSLTVGSLEAGARYAVRVQARGAGGAGALSIPAYVVPSGPRPGAPRHVTARAHGGVVTVRWRAARSATQYVVRRRDVTHHGPWQPVATEGPLVTRVLRLGGLRAATTYTFRVTALHQRVVGGTSHAVRVRTHR